MRIFSKVSSQDFFLIKILSHTINQARIRQPYTVYELSERVLFCQSMLKNHIN